MNKRLILTLVIVLLVMIILKVHVLKAVSVYTISRLTSKVKQMPLQLVESCIFETIKPYVMPTLNKYKII